MILGLGADPDEDRQDPRPERSLAEIAPRWAWVAVAGMTTAVIAFSAIRGVIRGFQPLGDNALVELRAWDVFTADRPLLGTWSSASVSAGTDVNHPGPLLFQAMAVPVRLFGGPTGLAVGGAAVNVAAVWAAVLIARRIGGRVSALAVALAAAVLAWSLGSELLYDVWQPNILVLPFFAFLVAIWAMALGQGWAVVPAVILGSLCLQAHLSYLFLVPALLLAGLAALVWRDRGDVLARQGRWLLGGLAIGLALWAPPLWEQLSGGDDGNLARLARSSGSQSEELAGFSLAVRMLAEVVAIPPAFARPGYESSIPLTTWVESGSSRSLPVDVASFPVAVLALVVVGALLGYVARAAGRRGDTTIAAGVVVLGVAVVAGLASATISPIDVLGLSPHKFRWMWSLGAFSFTLLLAGLGRIAVTEGSPRVRQAATTSALAVGALVSLLTLPAYAPPAGPVDQQSAYPIVESLRRQVRDADLDGTVLVDDSGLFFAEPYTSAVMAELARDGVPFAVRSVSLSRQVGPARLDDGTAAIEMTFRHDAGAEDTPPGARRIAYHPGDGRWPAIGVFVRELDG